MDATRATNVRSLQVAGKAAGAGAGADQICILYVHRVANQRLRSDHPSYIYIYIHGRRNRNPSIHSAHHIHPSPKVDQGQGDIHRTSIAQGEEETGSSHGERHRRGGRGGDGARLLLH